MKHALASAEKYLFALPVLLLVGAYCFCVAWMSIPFNGTTYYLLQDDPMISMRYAYNLAHGIGLVWNSGEHVQGYTNLGLTLIMAAFHCLGLGQALTSLVVQIFNLLVLLGVMVLLYAYFTKHNHPRIGLWAATVVAFNASIFSYAVCGWETPLQMLLVTAAFLPCIPLTLLQTENKPLPPFAPFLCALAVFVRLDAVIPFVIISAYQVVDSFLSLGWPIKTQYADASKSRSQMVTMFLWIAAGACCILSVLVFQKMYYGDWLPNTYFLKASADARNSLGDSFRNDYFKEFFFAHAYIVPSLCSAVYLALGMRNGAIRKQCALLLSILGIWIYFVYWVGGDCFKLGRFFIMIIPIVEICTILLIAELWRRAQRPDSKPVLWLRSLSTLLALSVAVQLFLFPLDVLSLVIGVKNDNRRCLDAWQTIKQKHVPDGTLIGIFKAGTMPYLMPEMRFHDMLGKSDRTIAHTVAKLGAPGHCKWDYDYSLGVVKPPILIVIDYDDFTPESLTKLIRDKTPFSFLPLLWFDEHFRKHYLPNVLPRPKSDIGTFWILFYR